MANTDYIGSVMGSMDRAVMANRCRKADSNAMSIIIRGCDDATPEAWDCLTHAYQYLNNRVDYTKHARKLAAFQRKLATNQPSG